jgi:Flp pilus assembly pilin Flp
VLNSQIRQGTGGWTLHPSDVLPVQDRLRENQKRRINTMMELMKRFVKQEEGQDLVEYALLLVFLALAAIAVLPTLGKAVNNVFSQSASSLTTGS